MSSQDSPESEILDLVFNSINSNSIKLESKDSIQKYPLFQKDSTSISSSIIFKTDIPKDITPDEHQKELDYDSDNEIKESLYCKKEQNYKKSSDGIIDSVESTLIESDYNSNKSKSAGKSYQYNTQNPKISHEKNPEDKSSNYKTQKSKNPEEKDNNKSTEDKTKSKDSEYKTQKSKSSETKDNNKSSENKVSEYNTQKSKKLSEESIYNYSDNDQKNDDKKHDNKKDDDKKHDNKKDDDKKHDDKDDDKWSKYIYVIIIAIVITMIFLILAYPMIDVWMTMYVEDSTYRWLLKSLLFFILLIIILSVVSVFIN